MPNNSRFFFALLSVGAAIGIGNIFILPYFEFNLSGMFFIPYFIALVVMGVPLLILEFSAGQFFNKNAVDMFASIRNGFSGIGWLMVFNAFIVMCIYAVALAWHIIYIFVSFGLQWKSSPRAYFFDSVLQVSDGFRNFAEFSLPLFIVLILAWILIFLFIRKGYETVKKTFLAGVSVLAVLMILSLFYFLTLDNALDGVYSFLTPSWPDLFELKNWIAAFSIAVLSLGVSYGMMGVFARKIKNGFVVANSLIVAASEFLAGVSLSLILFSLFGFLDARQAIGLGFSDYGNLFVTLTQALSLLPKPTLASMMFLAFLSAFFMLATSALAYSVAHVLVHKFNTKHVQASILVCGFGFLLGLLFIIKPGYYIMDIVMHFIYYNILIALLLEVFAIGWFFNSEKIAAYINQYSIIKIGALWKFMSKYVVPVILLLLLAFQLKSDLAEGYNNYPLWALLVFGLGVVVIPILAAFLMPRKILDRK